MLNEIRSEDAGERHKAWIAEIRRGAFSFGPEEVAYEGEGHGSWKHRALGTLDYDVETHTFREEFLGSDWKLFHDALHAHRFDVMHHILPDYGICAA
jgi:hypothetical protein